VKLAAGTLLHVFECVGVVYGRLFEVASVTFFFFLAVYRFLGVKGI
jgi:hypothetical protein